MNEKIFAHEIQALLEKINAGWNSAGRGQHGISRIEKDILMNDLRQLYDKVYQMPVCSDEMPDKKPMLQNQEPASMIFRETFPEITVETEPELQAETFETAGPMEEKTAETRITHENNASTQIPIQQEMPQMPSFQPAKNVARSTAEMFPPSKTVADVYQKTPDNSLAARMQTHRINDIKSAIGVNEKIMFLRDLFDNDISKYNEGIDYLNKTVNYYEALQYIDQLKHGKLNDENKASFAKLLEFTKRKFY